MGGSWHARGAERGDVRTTREQLEFHRDDRAAAVAAMVELAGGTGWINFDAGVDADVPVPSRSVVFSVLAAVGPDVPQCSWVPERGRPLSVGIRYGSGRQAAKRLAELGVPVPDGWRVLQDHPRRGLALSVLPEPASADEHDRVLSWLLTAGAALSTVPLSGYWLATIVRTGRG
jgi:hypothetical protein